MMSGSLWVEMTVLVQIHNIWRTDAFYMRCRFIFLTITHIARTGLWVAMHGTGLVMIITRSRRCLWNFMVKYGNFDIYLTLDCTNSGVQISLCLTNWGLVAQYIILSLAEMVTLVQVMDCFLFDTKSLPEPIYSEQTGTCCTIGHARYQVICKYRLRYMK